VEPVIGHMKQDNRMERNFLKGKEGDRINAILAGAGYNMRKLLAAIANFFLRLPGNIKMWLIAVLSWKISDRNPAICNHSAA